MDPLTAAHGDIILRVLHRIERRLHRQSRMLVALGAMEAAEMDIGTALLAKVTAQGTTVDSIVTLIQGLEAAGTISADTAAQINAVIDGNETKLETALQPATPGA